MLRPLLGENVSLQWTPSDETCPVVLDPSQLDQILTNLCANARDAIDGIGELRIATQRVTLDALAAEAIPGAVAGDYVRLTCRDSGRGIPPDLLGRIFEPFFTTKPQGRGTGLGLSTVYGIVRQHHGAITVQSAPDAGTQFDLYFPRHHEDARALTPPTGVTPLKPTPEAARATVLVVEDESAVLQLTCRALSAQGYRVLAADGPEEALRLLDDHAASVDLLLTDVMMPVMSGPDLARRVTEQHRGIRVLFMSGYSADLIARHNRLEDETELLSKPFTLAELTRRVAAALERRPAA
jgi:CheY-like chemotaxis protein